VAELVSGDKSAYHVRWRRLLVEPRRPEWIRLHPKAPWLVVATVCIGAFMGQLDASIVTLAVPSIQQDFRAPLATVEWVFLVYLLILIGAVSAVGRMADMVGRKLLYIYGFGVFTAASLGCALAPNMGWLIATRIVQALGAAMLQANSVALIRTNMPSNKLGKAIGLQGAAQAVGLALGPSVGGFLIGLGGWRWAFYINLPAGAIGLILGWFLIPRTRVFAPKMRFDWIGLYLIMPTVAAGLLAFSQAGALGFANPFVLGMLAVAIVLGVAFVMHERRSRSPLLDISLFRSRNFSLGITTALLCYLVLFGVLFIMPLYLEGEYHLAPARVGLLIMILPVALAVVAPAAGNIADRWGNRLPTTIGMTLTAFAFLLLALLTPSILIVALVLAVAGLGLGLFTPANNSTIVGSGQEHQAGMVSGVLNMTRGIGTSLGVALAGMTYAIASGVNGIHIATLGNAVSGMHIVAALLGMLAFISAGLSVAKARK